jgi:hypothetical protein
MHRRGHRLLAAREPTVKAIARVTPVRERDGDWYDRPRDDHDSREAGSAGPGPASPSQHGPDHLPGDEEPHGQGLPTRAKRTVVLVAALVFLATLVLCCMAVGQAGQLWQLQLPSP